MTLEEKKERKLGFEAGKLWLTRDPQELYLEYLNKNKLELPSHTLLGMINIKNNQITLIPCIKDRTVMVYDDKKEFVGGWKIDSENLKKQDLTAAEIQQYNESGIAPRFLILQKYYEQDNPSLIEDYRVTAHEYLIQLKGEEKSIADYRGFAVVPEDAPQYLWTSGSLNSPRNSKGQIIERLNAAKMDLELQCVVQKIIGAWGIAITGGPDFVNLEALPTKLSEDDNSDEEYIVKFNGTFYKQATNFDLWDDFLTDLGGRKDQAEEKLNHQATPTPSPTPTPSVPGAGINQQSFAIEIESTTTGASASSQSSSI